MMRKILSLLLASLLLVGSPAFAAYTYGTPSDVTIMTASGTVTPVCTVASSDVVAYVGYNPGGGTISITSFADEVGGYSQVGATLVSGASANGAVYLVTGRSAATHTLVVNFSSATAGYLVAFCVGGAGAADGAAGFDSSFASGADSVVGGSVTTTSNLDSIIGLFETVSSGGTLSAGTGFTSVGVPTAGNFGEQRTQTTAGTISATATPSAAGEVIAFTLALHPTGGGSSCTNPGWDLSGTGNWTIPNGTSGTFYGKSGAKVTPTCTGTATTYYQKSGVFGNN